MIDEQLERLEEVVKSLPWPKKFYDQRMKLFEEYEKENNEQREGAKPI